MSWSNRFGGWARGLSPFSASPTTSQTQVNESDYSYMTAEDIAKEKALQNAAKENRSSRDTDVVLLKHRKTSYPVHFAAYSIDDGDLTIGAIRKSAAKKVDLPESDFTRVKLFYRGKTLKDDHKKARDEGLRSDQQAEILIVVGGNETITRPDSPGSDEMEVGSKSKRKKKKNAPSRDASGTHTPTQGYSSTPMPDATYAPGAAPKPSAVPKPQQAKPVLTAVQKLESIESTYRTTLAPECEHFLTSPPADAHKLDFDYKRLSETILAQVLLKLDGVETDGNDEARQMRKALVRETQEMLNRLDRAVGKKE